MAICLRWCFQSALRLQCTRSCIEGKIAVGCCYASVRVVYGTLLKQNGMQTVSLHKNKGTKDQPADRVPSVS